MDRASDDSDATVPILWSRVARDLREVLIGSDYTAQSKERIAAIVEPLARRARELEIPVVNLAAAFSNTWDHDIAPQLTLPTEQMEWMRWHILGIVLTAYRIE